MTTTPVKISFVSKANSIAAVRRIKSEVAKALNDGRSYTFTPEWTSPIEVSERRDRGGYGPLHVSGEVEWWNGCATLRYELRNSGSQWKNYGAPNGTIYDVEIEMIQVPTTDEA
jgi:hypothetical protein